MATNFPILLLDDDPDLGLLVNQAASHSFPEAYFHQVFTNGDAQVYLNELKGCAPRLILVDINISSQESGLDFLAYLKAHPKAKVIPAIILTVSEEETDLISSYLGGANAYMVKPTDFESWLAHLAIFREYWLNTVYLPDVFL